MKTKYEHFREFLRRKYPKAVSDGSIPEPYMLPDGDEKYDDDTVVGAITRILDYTEGDKWSDIETSIGNLDYSDFLDTYEDNCMTADDFDEKEFRRQYYGNEDNARNLCGALQHISDYFVQWISGVRIKHNKKADFEKLINSKEDYFLNFNYTLTLEKLYGAQNVCHIHGKKGDYYLYFGHGNNEDKMDKYQRNWFGAENELIDFERCLKKDVFSAYSANKDFFKKITNIGSIYSFGFAYSFVDEFYVERICEIIKKKDIVWHLNDYKDPEKPNEIERFKEVIKRNGFVGSFSTFHVG